MLRSICQHILVALLLTGSAILLFACEKDSVDGEYNDENLMTMYSENLTVIESDNGRKSYVFVSPLVEGYALAKEPYQEFRKGIDIVTYQKDSAGVVDATLTANYAIHYEKRNLWEAKGNVVVKKSNGQELYTQQLYWNEKTHRIWSNVDTKIVEEGGRDEMIVEGFESDDALKDPRFRRIKGRMRVNIEPTPESDSTRIDKKSPETTVSKPATKPSPKSDPNSRSGPIASPSPSARVLSRTKRVGKSDSETSRSLPRQEGVNSAK